MRYGRLISIILVLALVVTAVQPMRAEAEPVAVAVVVLGAVIVAFYTTVGIEVVRGRPFDFGSAPSSYPHIDEVDCTPPQGQ